MKQKQPGALIWSSLDDAWIGSASVPYFRGCGEKVTDEDDGEAPAHLEGDQFPLHFETACRKPPAPAQIAAWDKIMARGDEGWDEVMDCLVAEYQAQRLTRVRWWKAVYGDRGLDKVVPEAGDSRSMLKLVRPVRFVVKPAAKDADTADVGILAACSWSGEGFAVVLRGGGTSAEFGPVCVLYPPLGPVKATLEEPVFGRLRRFRKDGPWIGVTRFDALHPYTAVAHRRAMARNSTKTPAPSESDLEWEYCRGEFGLVAYAAAGKKPTDVQAAALVSLRDGGDAAAAVLDSVFKDYAKNHAAFRRGYEGDHAAEAVPKLTGPDGLGDLVQLVRVYLHPEDASGGVTAGLQFSCTWRGDSGGFGVLVRDGKVEGIEQGWNYAEQGAGS